MPIGEKPKLIGARFQEYSAHKCNYSEISFANAEMYTITPSKSTFSRSDAVSIANLPYFAEDLL